MRWIKGWCVHNGICGINFPCAKVMSSPPMLSVRSFLMVVKLRKDSVFSVISCMKCVILFFIF